jgi:hypothetical protein
MCDLGTIQKIEEIYTEVIEKLKDLNKIPFTINHSMEGYRIITDKHTFELLIDSEAQCCESFGYFACTEDIKYFIGSTLLKVELTDTALDKKLILDRERVNVDDTEYTNIQFVDFTTSLGVLQIAVYNSHNGYYGHKIVFKQNNEYIMEDRL